ncbi:type I-C CRISPR-associated endonuclease Cas1c [Plantactinospora endophytica]|uniref:CRISPR-associated endonuclease Cas1 n=1 Tax=Plantactinospora endophytica TaxID=673535 RepID=A0ABQ4EEF5_9ACTN|nr:type I-C CRISPR-associated endonuclease Cas1c [Plantactinospora endophytica]GIG93074.1 CRISPR-associated endonuclease Cas1 1 [Plantactinospora endophytica]
MPEIIKNTLYVLTPGSSLHLDSDAVRVFHPANGAKRLPLIRIDHVVAFGGVTITDDFMHRCAADQRSVTWLSGNGRFRARVVGPQGGNPLLRVAQHDALRDNRARLDVARTFVAGKLQNTRQLLMRSAADAKGERQEALRKTATAIGQDLTGLPNTDNLNVILGIEGQGAKRYVRTWPHLLVEHSQVAAPTHRVSRPPTDPVNAALSFGYGMLRVAVHGALEHVGLDPYIGYLHGIRPGKPALALDLMEEMRQLLVDRLVFTAFNRRQLLPQHFAAHTGGACELSEDGRRAYLALWSESRARLWPHRQLGREIPAAVLPIIQARLLARHLRGDMPRYTPWSPA